MTFLVNYWQTLRLFDSRLEQATELTRSALRDHQKSIRGPEGRPPNISPARKGWETDRQDCGALEARHYLHSGCRTSGARTMLRNRPSPPGLVRCLANGPTGLGPIRGLFSSFPHRLVRAGDQSQDDLSAVGATPNLGPLTPVSLALPRQRHPPLNWKVHGTGGTSHPGFRRTRGTGFADCLTSPYMSSPAAARQEVQRA
jgi:hypothetical protein